jgi:hypothetical protein
MTTYSLNKIALWTWYLLRFVLLVILFFVFFAIGGNIVGSALPSNLPSEPGPLPLMSAGLVISAASVLTIVLMILSSQWYGWKLMVAMAITYYGVVTFMTQIETWYFLEGLTVSPNILPLLFLQGVPVAFIFVPLAVIILGRVRKPATPVEDLQRIPMTLNEWAWKLAVIAAAYLVLYFGAGYFIAWQNPELRAFYGAPGEPLSFAGQMMHIFTTDPWLTPFQILRSLLWMACALPILRGSRWPLWATALVVALMFSMPQNIVHLMPNPLIPENSVRISHLIETMLSTFVFGLLVSWLLYPKHVHVPVTQPQAKPLKPQTAAR